MYQTMHKQEPVAGAKRNQAKSSSPMKSEKKHYSNHPWTSQSYTFRYQGMQLGNKTTGISDSLRETIRYPYGIPVNDAKTYYDLAQPAQLHAWEFAQNAHIPATSGWEKSVSQEYVTPITQLRDIRANNNAASDCQSPQSVKNFSVLQNTVIQRQIYNPEANKILDRPKQPKDIKSGEGKDAGMPLTAHHIIPWKLLKQHIETAFTIPPLHGSNTFLTLEAFANEEFPADKKDFLRSTEDRIKIYNDKKEKINAWIKSVCWSQKNIFLGPESDKRVDDPEKRIGSESTIIDAHYAKPGEKSDNSKTLASFQNFNLGEEDRKQIWDMENKVTGYNSEEWYHYKLNQKDYYYQKNDPFFEKNVQERYLYEAFYKAKAGNTNENTKYTIYLYTLRDYSIHDVTFLLKKKTQGNECHLCQNAEGNAASYSVHIKKAEDEQNNSQKYEIVFAVPGKDAPIHDIKAVICTKLSSGDERKVECRITRQSSK